MDTLHERRVQLGARYMTPVMASASWTADACHSASAFVALLHSEIEQAMEDLAWQSVDNAAKHTRHFSVHPILLNVVSYFRGEVGQRMSHLLPFVPSRTTLVNDNTRLADVWDHGGASVWYRSRVEDSHGTRLNYIAGLLHPLGLQLDENDFKRSATSKGVTMLASALPAERDELEKLARLRGAVAHGGYFVALNAFQPHSLTDIDSTATHAVEAVTEVAKRVMRCW